ncbi:hypothetical protein GAY29_06255 [Azospirillum brasilense]|uniref:radical SAM protein n=1 Tax=Azospirillum brasilense TaxID=192 RepID=UPI00190D87FC|nr:radical SAM protein [Azospirillum brasilense]MBK3732716.1 hypothetical protein [Azospirillum brasilense]
MDTTMLNVKSAEFSHIDLLNPAPSLKHIAFNFTNRCNLRCVYCPQGTHPESFHAESSDDQIRKIVDYVRSHDIERIDIGYYGETLLVQGWEDHCRPLLDQGLYITLVSSFSRILKPEEVEVVARFSELQMSIDTIDIQLLKQIRKAVDARTILYNTHLVRSYVLANDLPMPKIVWTGVLTDQIVSGIPDLVAMAVSSGIRSINFNDVAYFEGTSGVARSIYDMEPQDFIQAAGTLERARRLAVRHGVELSIGGTQRVERRLIEDYGIERYVELTRKLSSFDDLDPARPVYIYGAGEAGRTLRNWLRAHPELRFAGYIDSARSGAVDNEVVLKFDDYKAQPDDGGQIVIGSMHENEIERRLIDAGVVTYWRGYNFFQDGGAPKIAGAQPSADIVRSGIQGKFVMPGDVMDDVPPGMTRMCEAPWAEIYFDPKGEAYSCCQRGLVMGKLENGVSIDDIIGSDAYRRLRQQLLTGQDLDSECLRCTGRQAVPVERMRDHILGLMNADARKAAGAAGAPHRDRD